jgi:lysophospholipase L1-like esterase
MQGKTDELFSRLQDRVPFRMVFTKLGVSLTAACLLFAAPLAFGQAQPRWVGSWATSQQLTDANESLSRGDLVLRQIVHVSIGGEQLRVHLSNRFGNAPLHVASLHIAKAVSPASPAIGVATDKALTFSGSQDVTIPAGADSISDALAFPLAPLSDLAITLRIEKWPAQATGHSGSRATSYAAPGDSVSAADLPGAAKVEHWYFISGVDVASAKGAAIIALGDSITDGHGAGTDKNERWTDALARRLQAVPATRAAGVLNQGIGGNRLLLDGLGPNALARFDHDVLAQAGARTLIVLEGINDIGTLARTGEVPAAEHDALVHRIIAAYEQMVTRAHTHGIKVIGATILPFVGSSYYHPGAASEADRQAVNLWIRAPGHFDGVIDFDKATRDPEHPDRMLPAFDIGDHLHPSPAGYAAMADAVPLSLLTAGASPTAASRRMALTFDDLPAHGPAPAGETRVEVARKILTALRDAHVAEAYGFVNGQRLEQEPEDARVLQAWREAGYPLGNHTWSHMDLNRNQLETFEADITRNELSLGEWMRGQDWHWFRFPFLAEGDTPAKAAAVRQFLGEHDYKVAAVTMSFGDYRWNEPYARCRTRGDKKAIALLEKSYLAAAEQSIADSAEVSRRLYGREIPYVLLMHIGAFDAEMLPRLLKLYESRDFRFVTLAEAENDEFYRADTNLRRGTTADASEGAMIARRLPLAVRAVPSSQVEELCR